jgi:hypothetical protein
VIVGRKLSVEEAEKILPNSNVMVDTHIWGGDADIMTDDFCPRMFDVFKRAAKGEWGEELIPTFYEVFVMSEYNSELQFNPKDLPHVTMGIFELSIDQNRVSDADHLLALYRSEITKWCSMPQETP